AAKRKSVLHQRLPGFGALGGGLWKGSRSPAGASPARISLAVAGPGPGRWCARAAAALGSWWTGGATWGGGGGTSGSGWTGGAAPGGGGGGTWGAGGTGGAAGGGGGGSGSGPRSWATGAITDKGKRCRGGRGGGGPRRA